MTPLRGRTAVAGTASAVLLACLAGARSPEWVARTYVDGIGLHVSRALSVATGWIPVSVGELLLAALLALGLVLAGRGLRRVRRRETRLLAAAGRGAMTLALAILVAVSAFEVAWGLHYAAPALPERLGWTASPGPHGADELRGLGEELVQATNAAYREAAGSEDLGRPTALPAGVAALDAALERSFPAVARALPLWPGLAVPRAPAKPILASLLLSRLGISGFYFPWTGEANYNRDVPACSLPHVIAHEKAHQRGAAREDEAGFLGYLACALSGDAYARYAGLLDAQRDLLLQLRQYEPETVAGLVKQRHPGVQRDVAALVEFWRRHQGLGTQLGATVNDRYLRAQGVPDGIASYDRSVQLLVLFARSRGGRVVP